MPQPQVAPNAAPKRPATYADILALPPEVTGQIVDGELIVLPRPRVRHASASSVLGAELNFQFHRKPNGPDRPGGWWILFEPELHFGSNILVPDLAGWRHERMPELIDEPFFTLPPDWVCEVLSPTTARIDRIKKARIYGQQGVQWLWLVEPQSRTVEVMQRRNDGHWDLVQTFGDEATPRIPPFEAVMLELDRWWLGPDPAALGGSQGNGGAT